MSREIGKDRIKVMGYLDKAEVAQQMLISDALILPSRCREPAPLVPGEAAHHGLGAIVADHGGLKEFVKDGVNGLYFKAGNMDSLKKILKKAAAEPGLLEKIGENAHKMIMEAGLDLHTHIDRIEDFYRIILSNKK
jgi:glycosyltransferase involved in cell wall biosynthesis